MRFVQIFSDILLELSPDIDIRFIKKRYGTSRGDFSRDLPGHPSIFTGVANEYPSGGDGRRHHGIVLLALSGQYPSLGCT